MMQSSAYGAGGLKPPCRKKNCIIRAKLMYRSGKETVKNILLFDILIYLFSNVTCKGLLAYLGLELIVPHLLELKRVRFISHFMVLYFRNIDLDLPRIFALF